MTQALVTEGRKRWVTLLSVSRAQIDSHLLVKTSTTVLFIWVLDGCCIDCRAVITKPLNDAKAAFVESGIREAVDGAKDFFNTISAILRSIERIFEITAGRKTAL